MSSIFAYIHFNPQTLSMHEHANTYIHACTCAYKHMHTHTNAHKHVHEHTNPHKRMHTHTHTHMQTRTHTYMHTHKHKLKEFDHKKMNQHHIHCMLSIILKHSCVQYNALRVQMQV